MNEAGTAGERRELGNGVMTLPQVVIQAISSVGPALAVFVTFQPMVALAGASTPFIQIVDLAIVLMLASTLIQLSRMFPSAGGYFTYVSETLGPSAGFLVSWIYVLYSATSPGVLFAYLGRFLELNLAHVGLHVSWVAFFLCFCAIVAYIVYRGISFSARAMMGIAAVEIAIVLALGCWGFLPGSRVAMSFEPFRPTSLGPGMFAMAAMFGIFTYMGWESAAPLAEESKNPRRNIPLAVVISIIVNCILKVVCFWGMILSWGVDRMPQLAAATAMPPIILAQRFWGGWWILVLLAIANSVVGVGIAFSIVSSRMWFAMGRAGVLPRGFAAVSSKHGTPTVATAAQIGLFLVSGLGGAAWVGIDQLYLAGGLATVFSAILVYILANLALMKHMMTSERGRLRFVAHLLLPAVSTAVLVFILYKSVTPLPAYPMLYGPLIVAVWLVVGLILVVVLHFAGQKGLLAQAGKAGASVG